MIRLLRADLIRLGRSFSFRLSLMAMLGLSAAFMTMQATAMDYSVPLSRVIFLPMSMYGVTMAAFVSVFVGTDFSDGFIRNKLLTAEHRYNLVVAQIIVSCLACLIGGLLLLWSTGSRACELSRCSSLESTGSAVVVHVSA